MKSNCVIHNFLFLYCLTALTLPVASADTHQARGFVDFSELPDQDCEEKGGMRVFVHNRHQQKIIDLQLDRYFSGVRQGGRSMFALPANTKQPLGCSFVLDAEQSWQLISAEFISAEKAQARYGEVSSSPFTQ